MTTKPGYKRTDVGVVPNDWVVAPLESFTSFISYGFTNPMPTSEGGIFMITAKDIFSGQIQFATARCTTEEAYRTLLTAKSRPQKWDILLTKDGTLGRLALADDRKICINQSVAILRPNSKVSPRFLKILLEAPAYQARMIEDAGGSTIKHIYITIVNRMPIAVPCERAEQEAIAAALSDADEWIASLDRLIAKKRDIKQATMQQLLTGKTRLPGFEEEWKEVTIGSISAFITKGATPTTYGFNWQSDGVRFLRSECVAEEGLDLTQSMFISAAANQVLRRSEIRSGDLLITITGNVGRVIYLYDNFGTGNINQHIARIRISSNEADARYILYHLSQIEVREYFNSITTGQAYPQIGLKQVRDTTVPLPAKREQTAIADILAAMDFEIENVEAIRAKARAIKQGMMQELLTGRVRLI